MTTDHLGSTRVVTNDTGGVKARHDLLPFGEEIASNIGGRGGVAGYTAQDSTRQRFTGHERDDASGLDFMQARYYSAAMGRFTSPDSFGGERNIPQTLNLYLYTLNNPLKYVDPTGNWPVITGIYDAFSSLDFFFSGYYEPPGDAGEGNFLFQGLRDPLELLINPGTVGAAYQVGIADTNLVSAILRGATPLELGVPSTTRLVITPAVYTELLATGGFTNAELDVALQAANIEMRDYQMGKLVENLWKVAGLLNPGSLSPNPAREASQIADASILAEAKTLDLPIFTNNVNDFNANALGGGTLAKRLDVKIVKTNHLNNLKPKVFPRLTDAVKAAAKKIIP